MDWSSVYEDQHENDGDWFRSDENPATRTTLLRNFIQEYSPLTCYFFTVNYILGVGCLGVPYAFNRCGIFLGSCFILGLSYVSYVTVMWVADMLLTYIGLLAYTQVFNASFNDQVWPSSPWWVSPFLFSIMVVPLSCIDLSEQVTSQIIMSILRFISLGAILIGTIVAIFVNPTECWYTIHNPFIATSKDINLHLLSTDNYPPLSIPLVKWEGAGIMFTTAIFSQLFQHSVPGLIRPLAKEDKKYIPTIFRCALITTGFLYITIGIASVIYFGDSINPSINTNFVGFRWGIVNPDDDLNVNSSEGVLQISTRAISLMIVLFPALDTISVFPLIANTLGNNLNSSFPGLFKQFRVLFKMNDIHAQRKIILILWRLVAAIPPILASRVTNLALSLQLAGFCGIIVALVIPALLIQCTTDRIQSLPSTLNNSIPFNTSYGSTYLVVFVISLAVLAMVICAEQMI